MIKEVQSYLLELKYLCWLAESMLSFDEDWSRHFLKYRSTETL